MNADRERVVAIVQARMGSTRFPGKMMAELAGAPLIEWVLERVSGAARLDAVVLATSIASPNDALAVLAAAHGVGVIRGEEHDVLARFVRAAADTSADWIVRICADNPFVDPRELDRLVSFTLARRPDYAFNHVDRLASGYADGFGAEMFSRVTLEQVAEQAQASRDREHVTTFVWDHPDRFRILALPAPSELAYGMLRFDVDTPEDLDRLQPLAAAVGKRGRAAQFVAAERARS